MEFPHKDLTYKIIGIAMEIHRELGPAFKETVYEEVMIDETILLAQVPNAAISRMTDIPHQAGSPTDQNQKETAELRALR